MGTTVHAAPGQLNPVFAGGGMRVLAVPQPEFPNRDAMVSLPLEDGGLMFAYECRSVNVRICVVRVNTDGTLNSAFASGGVLSLSAEGNPSRPVLLHRLSSSFVLLMHCEAPITGKLSPCSYWFNASGVINTAFSPTGLLKRQYLGTSDSRTYAAASRFDGTINTHYECGGNLCFERLFANGNRDASWGNNGFVSHAINDGISAYSPTRDGAIAARPDGSSEHFVVCFRSFSEFARCALKLNDAGALIDTRVETSTRLARVTGARVSANGDVLLGQICEAVSLIPNPPTHSLRNCLSRLSNDMSVVPTQRWFTAGNSFNALPALAPSPWLQFHSAVELAHDGKVYHAYPCAHSTIPSVASLCISRRHADGGLDQSYGVSGISVLEPSQNGLAAGDERSFVFGGFSVNESGVAWAIVLSQVGRCSTSGSCSTSIPENVTVIQLLGGPNDNRACTHDVHGDGDRSYSDDLQIFSRAALGFTDFSVMRGVFFPSYVSRRTWPAIRDHLSNHCRVRALP
jgi:hypothetical protein